MPDEDLAEQVRRAQGGDREALEQVVRALEAPLYQLAVRMLGNPELSKDATQEVLIVVITQLSAFRGEASITSWAYRVAMRHLLRLRHKQRQRWRLETMATCLGKPPNEILASSLSQADERLLEEEAFLGCTQVMLLALPPTQRAAFVLGALCELETREGAYILGTNEVAFRKRLSRARALLDDYVAQHCGVANQANPCRCAYQVNANVANGFVNPGRLRFASKHGRTSLETLRALGEIRQVRKAVELYRAQPAREPPTDLAAGIRRVLDGTHHLGLNVSTDA